MFRFIVLIIALNIACCGIAQAQKKYSVKSNRAVKQYQLAGKAYQKGQNQQAMAYLQKAVKTAPDFVEAYLFMADIYHSEGDKTSEINMLEKAVAINAAFFPAAYINLAQVYREKGEYQKAKKAVEQFMALKTKSLRVKKRAEKELQKCNYALQLKAKPIAFHPKPLGTQINTTADEYWVTPTVDEQALIFTRLTKNRPQEDFYISTKTDSVWSEAVPLSVQINTPENEGAQSITADGKTMYFTACNRRDGYGRCDIYYTKCIGGKWTTPINVGAPVNSGAWEAQPSISADGRTLYFVSNRKSGKGKMDIYRSYLLETLPNGRQRWSKPENMSFNTPENEMSPFIHAGDSDLIFASDGLPGMGKLDLYRVTKDKKGEWQKPRNMGYPINTCGNEMGLVINAGGSRAYFASDRDSTMGKDIYTFMLPESLRLPKAAWIKGIVRDSITQKPLSANLQLVDLQTNDTIYQLQSDRVDGTFLICLPQGKDYGLSAEKQGYFFYSNHFDTSESSSQQLPKELILNLVPVQLNQPMILNNLFFKVDSWEIDAKSENELNRLVFFLQQNSRLKVEIAGHTDSSGSAAHNQILSEKRAKAVCSYLASKGIDNRRLSAVGYGSNRPIADNNTEEGKAKNRRTTFLLKEE